MFQLGEHVMHPQQGVCKITDRITMDAREYYVLSPLSDHKLKLYIPILSSKKIGVRVLASEAELRSLYQEAEQADTPGLPTGTPGSAYTTNPYRTGTCWKS